MKKLLLIVPILILLASCKKKYSCTCNTQYNTTYGGNVNQAQYNVKDYSETGAHDQCLKLYQENYTTATTYTCNVM